MSRTGATKNPNEISPRIATSSYWISKWFSLYNELGEPTEITMGAYNEKTHELKYHFFSHEKGDGFTALISTFEEYGWNTDKLLIPPFPREPSFLQRLKSLLRYPLWSNVTKTDWKSYDRNKTKCYYSFSTLSEEQTKEVLSFCKSEGVSLNAFLLFCLNNQVSRSYLRPRAVATWWIPVDMRTIFGCGPLRANVTSSIACTILSQESLRDVSNDIRKRLRRWDHWGAWHWMQIGKLIGVWGMRKILHRQIQTQNWVGTFTFIGAWPTPEMSCEARSSDWIFFGSPQATRTHPIASGAGIWKGKLVFTISAMGCIGITETETQKLVAGWKEELCSNLSHQEVRSPSQNKQEQSPF